MHMNLLSVYQQKASSPLIQAPRQEIGVLVSTQQCLKKFFFIMVKYASHKFAILSTLSVW